jgi:Tol biopolymer transport system component
MRHALLLVSLAVALLAASAQGTPPGTNGRIVFERLRLQNSPSWGELFVANSDGSGVQRLTHPPNGTEDTSADWSPDGKRIVFVRQPPKGVYSIWTVATDGSDLRRLTPPCPPGIGIPKCPADDGWPVWSPDGKHIAFQRFSGALRPKGATINDAKAIYKDALVVTDANGHHARTLVWLGPWRGDPQSPAWSPDGKRLVFVGKFMNSKTNGTGCECRALYVVSANGTGLRRILPPGLRPGARPDWSPDGTTILFRTHPGDDPSGIGANLYTIHPDGTELRQLTHFAASERVLDGSYSPDGRAIVFETSHGAAGGILPDVFVMNADGTGMHPITRTRNFETFADWGPGD